MNKRLISAAAAVALLGAGLSASASFAAPASPSPSSVRDAPTYVMMAGASDLYEIQSSQLELQTTQNPRLQNFAQMMVTDHTNTTQQVTSAAQSSGMSPPPPQLMPMQAQMIEALQAANGVDRDRLYVKQQTMAHQMALQLHTSYSSKGDTPALKSVASGALPIIKHHLSEIQSISHSVH